MSAREEPRLAALAELADRVDEPTESRTRAEDDAIHFDVHAWFQTYLLEPHDSPELAGLPFN
jgi:hypothetical protein